ncbi:MAG: prepilin-type N-terminal cleavage/methylation domain-containing protein [Chitinispirillales bacterium]|jgi:type II secretory pathway pseudopilin PulG|nr:prepilin-type N-terminal cleavage/methylation domain-containing protein [Chitinispirillales bacterium]
MMNKKGMTLVELIVYIVLAAFVLAPVIMLVNNSSISMARDAGRTNLQMSGREIMQIIYDDLKNTGFKVWPDGGGFGPPDTGATIMFSGTNYFKKDDGKCCKPGSVSSAPAGCTDACPNGDTTYNIPNGRGGDSSVTKVNPNSVYIVQDSSSFVNGNSYIKRWSNTNSAWADLNQNSTGCSGSENCKSLVARYDTLEARMSKLKKDGTSDNTYTIIYNVRDTTKFMLTRIVIPLGKPKSETVLARNVAAFKIRFSDNLKDWYDYFDKQKHEHILKKKDMQYIKVILVLRDPKKLAPTKNQTIEIIPAVAANDVTADYHRSRDAIIMTPTDQALYEKYEMVIPIPNNGLYP